MRDRAASTVLPLSGLVGLGLRPLPLMPLELLLRRLVAEIVHRHPELASRLEPCRGRRIAIVPSDLPFVILLEPQNALIMLRVVREIGSERVDARISGPLLALIGLADGTYDGDALFFSRDLSVDGDVEAVLSLRNAIDGAEIDLWHEAAVSMGPMAPLLDLAADAGAFLRRLIGIDGARSQGHMP